jgi:hypothetical protein
MDSTAPPLAVHAFTLAVIVNIVGVAQKKYMNSLGLWAVLPLALLFFTVPVRAAVCHRVNGRLTLRRGLSQVPGFLAGSRPAHEPRDFHSDSVE